MAGPHIWAAKKWSQYRQDVEKAKSKKRKEENDASQSDAEKKIRQWRKDRKREEDEKYVSPFRPIDDVDEAVDLKRYVQRPGKYSDIVIKTDLSRNPKELKKSAKSAERIGTMLHKGQLYNASGKVMKRITDDPKD